MDRHLTVSGFVVHEGRVALHWHRKIQAWLPAGGHIEPGEDPLQAALREVREEFTVDAAVIRTGPRIDYEGGPEQVDPPASILICPVEPGHEHVDLVYFFRLTSGYPGASYDPDNAIVWFDAAMLDAAIIDHNDGTAGPALPAILRPDVLAHAREAIRLVAITPAEATAR
jgi:8-oxo-dGTP pyrophosphatase MutT (NUDIX family)